MYLMCWAVGALLPAGDPFVGRDNHPGLARLESQLLASARIVNRHGSSVMSALDSL